MSRPVVTSVTIAAAQATGYALSQKPGAAGSLTLNGALVTSGVGRPDAPRRVAIASDADDSAHTFTITGTARAEQGGIALSETLTGPNNATVFTTQDFATVTAITISAAATGNITAGTNGVASGPWVAWSEFQTDFQVQLDGFVLSGSPTWQADYTPDDVFGTWLPANVPFPRAIAIAALTGKTGTASGAVTTPVRATRLTLTAVGGVQLSQTQQGF